jgi:hypothetical protein
MGNFYTNFIVRVSDQTAVASALQDRSAMVSLVENESVVVFDEESDSQDPEVLQSLGRFLSNQFHCPVLAIINHDDDVLIYSLFDNGEMIDEYNSSPGYFEGEDTPPSGGNAEKLCAAFKSVAVAEVRRILHDSELTFAIEKHQELVEALGLPTFSVGAGFDYISRGEFPVGLDEKDLVRTKP